MPREKPCGMSRQNLTDLISLDRTLLIDVFSLCPIIQRPWQLPHVGETVKRQGLPEVVR